MTKDYDVISADSPQQLVAGVREAIKIGWDPVGGMEIEDRIINKFQSISNTYLQTKKFIFHQTIVKKEKE